MLIIKHNNGCNIQVYRKHTIKDNGQHMYIRITHNKPMKEGICHTYFLETSGKLVLQIILKALMAQENSTAKADETV